MYTVVLCLQAEKSYPKNARHNTETGWILTQVPFIPMLTTLLYHQQEGPQLILRVNILQPRQRDSKDIPVPVLYKILKTMPEEKQKK